MVHYYIGEELNKKKDKGMDVQESTLWMESNVNT